MQGFNPVTQTIILHGVKFLTYKPALFLPTSGESVAESVSSVFSTEIKFWWSRISKGDSKKPHSTRRLSLPANWT